MVRTCMLHRYNPQSSYPVNSPKNPHADPELFYVRQNRIGKTALGRARTLDSRNREGQLWGSVQRAREGLEPC